MDSQVEKYTCIFLKICEQPQCMSFIDSLHENNINETQLTFIRNQPSTVKHLCVTGIDIITPINQMIASIPQESQLHVIRIWNILFNLDKGLCICRQRCFGVIQPISLRYLSPKRRHKVWDAATLSHLYKCNQYKKHEKLAFLVFVSTKNVEIT